jgi:hypothetical protein
VDARRTLERLLSQNPESNQAQSLLAETEEAIIREGLVTAGVVGGVAVVGGLLLSALLSGRRK